MRFWCVPSATDLESPKLPPRINRDVYLRSPPPPPRLSREEKMARGVMRDGGGGSARASDGNRVHRKKKRRKRKVPPSSSASAAVASLAAGSSGSMSDLNQYARLPPLPEGYGSLQTRRAKGTKAAAPSAAAGSSAGRVPPRTAAHHERSASMGELSTFKAADHRKKGKGSSAKVAAKVSKNGGVGGGGDVAELPQPSQSGGGAPNLVLHPGKSRSRERKNKLRKKGKTTRSERQTPN